MPPATVGRIVKPRILIAALTVTLSTACLFDGFAFELTDKRPIAPLEEYPAWWSATEACSGEGGDFARVRWYTAVGINYDGAFARGVWLPPHDIVLLRGYEDDEETVRHEMLHDLLDGDSGHEKPAWARCGLIGT
jgi:hypothetical protein